MLIAVHILMLPSWYPKDQHDANGSFFREQAETLVRAGLRVGVLAVRAVSIHEPDARSRAARERVTASGEQGVTVWRGIAVRPVPHADRLNARAVVARWKRLFWKYVEKHGMPDVLHAHTLNPGGLAAHAIAQETGLPFLVTEHRPETALADSRRRSLRSSLVDVQKSAASLVAVSPGFAEALTASYGVRDWTSVPNLLPPQFEAARIAEPDEPFTFGHVSNLEPYKRVDLLISSFHKAFGSERSVRLRIAGDSPNRAALEAQARALDAQNIEFVGRIARSAIVAEFSRYHAFVLTSRAESFGVVFWEAMACGLPVVATDTDGGRLAVSPSAGYLVPIDDGAALSERLTDMRQTRTFDREAIRARAIAFCGADTFVEQYRQLYNAAARRR